MSRMTVHGGTLRTPRGRNAGVEALGLPPGTAALGELTAVPTPTRDVNRVKADLPSVMRGIANFAR